MKYTVLGMLASITLSTSALAAQVDTKTMVGTFVFDSKKVNEATAIKIGEMMSANKNMTQVFVRQFRDANTWAVDMELTHNGTKEAFQKAVTEIEDSIVKSYGKDAITNKYVASSVTWIKK